MSFEAIIDDDARLTTDDGHQAVTKAHLEHKCSGELKIMHTTVTMLQQTPTSIEQQNTSISLTTKCENPAVN